MPRTCKVCSWHSQVLVVCSHELGPSSPCGTLKEPQTGWEICRYGFVLLLNCIHVLKPVVNIGLTGSNNQRAENLSFVSASTKLHLQRHLYSMFCSFQHHVKETKPLLKISFKRCFSYVNGGYKETSI